MRGSGTNYTGTGTPKKLPEDTTIERRMTRPGLISSGDEVIYDGGAEVDGYEPYKTVPEKYRDRPPPEGSDHRMREHWDGGFIVEFNGVVEFDSEAQRTGTPSLVGQRLPPPKKRRKS